MNNSSNFPDHQFSDSSSIASNSTQTTLEGLVDDRDKMTVSALLSLSYSNPSLLPSTSTGKRCRYKQCHHEASKRSPFCQDHIGSRTCEMVNCNKYAQGGTQYCISHGGGHRCTYAGCNKGARGKYFCALHGGGKRCSVAECNKLAVGGSSCCAGHGGGKKCSADSCTKAAQSPTSFCVRHGGGRQCSVEGCVRVSRGKTGLCASHGHNIQAITTQHSDITSALLTSSSSSLYPVNGVFYDEAKDMVTDGLDCITPPLYQFCMPANASPMRSSAHDTSQISVFNFTAANQFLFNRSAEHDMMTNSFRRAEYPSQAL